MHQDDRKAPRVVIRGAAMPPSVCASAVGPLPLAVFRELTGTYTLGTLLMMALPVPSVAVLLLIRPGRAPNLD